MYKKKHIKELRELFFSDDKKSSFSFFHFSLHYLLIKFIRFVIFNSALSHNSTPLVKGWAISLLTFGMQIENELLNNNKSESHLDRAFLNNRLGHLV